MKPSIIYLDHAAATPIDQRVVNAMLPYMTEDFYNPSSPYAPAVLVRRWYLEAKHQLAIAIGGHAEGVTITAGATESINLLFASMEGHVVTTAIEHHAVLAAAHQKNHTIVSVDATGIVKPEDIQAALQPDTVLVSVGLANNELGTIQPLRTIAEIIRTERKQRLDKGNTTPIYLHSDASQGVGQIDVNVARLGVDALTVNAGKVYGPKQVALLWTAPSVRLEPYVVGGGQENGLRSGTENVAGTIGFAVALTLAVEHRKSESARLHALRDKLQDRLVHEFPNAVLSGGVKKRLPGHLHISFPGIDAERLIFGLEREGVMVATGSACAANKGTRSHVLTAIGLDDDVADGSLRITLGRLSDDETIARAADILVTVIKHEYSRGVV
jgi:cysteine desulfurase